MVLCQLFSSALFSSAFPNFGGDLRRLAVHSVSGVKSLESLNGVRTPHPLSAVMDEETAYTLRGVFNRTHGLRSFRSLYETKATRRFTGSRSILLKRSGA